MVLQCVNFSIKHNQRAVVGNSLLKAIFNIWGSNLDFEVDQILQIEGNVSIYWNFEFVQKPWGVSVKVLETINSSETSGVETMCWTINFPKSLNV